MIKSFSDFILENSDWNLDINLYIRDIINMLNTADHSDSSYSLIGRKEYIDPFYFDLNVEAKFTNSPDFKNDKYFKNLQWEETNFNKNNFSINANVSAESDDSIPTLTIILILNPDKSYLNELKLRLVDLLNHELKHMTQDGLNKHQFGANPSSTYTRNKSKNDFNYFLLPEEMEAMIYGMYNRSMEENVDINTLFVNYLTPFIKNGFMTLDEYNIVFKKWLVYALEKYPDINVSISDKKVREIIDSL